MIHIIVERSSFEQDIAALIYTLGQLRLNVRFVKVLVDIDDTGMKFHPLDKELSASTTMRRYKGKADDYVPQKIHQTPEVQGKAVEAED